MSGKFFNELSWRLRQVSDFLGVRKYFNSRLYNLILGRAEGMHGEGIDFWTFMNYGYEPSDPSEKPELLPEDEDDRVCIQLYNHLVETVNMQGKSVLEVSCGRGGGANYAMRYLKPARYVGLDLSPNSIEFCKRVYDHDGLEFVEGDADDIPFGDNEFDLVVNIEASNGYHSVPLFFEQVHRVLKPGGVFLFADLRHNNRQIKTLKQQLADTPFVSRECEDITAGVLAALTVDSDRKEKIATELVPPFFLNSFLNFAAAKGSHMYKAFETGHNIYLSCRMTKAT
jgi:SAM-dependent methyltransferase